MFGTSSTAVIVLRRVTRLLSSNTAPSTLRGSHRIGVDVGALVARLQGVAHLPKRPVEQPQTGFDQVGSFADGGTETIGHVSVRSDFR